MEKLLKDPIVIKLYEILNDKDLCLVGGAVRDYLISSDQTILDYDFATKLKPEEVISKLENNSITSFYRAIRRGTVYVNIDGVGVDITTFRNPEKEEEYVETIYEDLSARDFTINSIALNINTGELIDPFNGINDLKNSIVKSVGIPEKRFTEDPHRIIRLVRFSYCNGRLPEESTLRAAKNLSHLIENVSWERLGAEVYKIIDSKNPSAGLVAMNEVGILNYILPELYSCIGIEQNKYHKFDVFGHTLSVLDSVLDSTLDVKFAALLHDIGKAICRQQKEDGSFSFIGHELESKKLCEVALARLKFTNYFTKKISNLVVNHMRSVTGSKKSIRRIIKDIGNENIYDWIDLKKADLFGGRPEVELNRLVTEWNKFIEQFNEVIEEPFQIKKNFLVIGGKDLLLLGFKEGPIVGKVLKELEELVLDNPLNNNKDFLLCEAKKLMIKYQNL